MNKTRSARDFVALHFLFFLSGAAALGYQLVWSKMFSTGLGHEYPAVLAIVSAFMFGMALGAVALDRFIPREARARWWLAGLELTIGAWAVLVSLFIPQINDCALQWIGLQSGAFKHWLVAFAVPALALLPATVAMGATLPAMEKFLSAFTAREASVGSIYAANTFGAVAGTLLAPWLVMPNLGLSKSCWALAALNLVVVVAVLVIGNRPADVPVAQAAEQGSAHEFRSSRRQEAHSVRGEKVRASLRRLLLRPGTSLSGRRIILTLFATGVLGIAFETAGVRVLSQVMQNTVYTYASILAVFLVGTAAGAAAFHRWWQRRDAARLVTALLFATSASCCAGILALAGSPGVHRFYRGLGDEPFAVLPAELLTAATVFALPTFFMGATFSHLVQQARAVSGRIGAVVAANTFGAALAPLGVVWLVPVIGAKWTLLAVALAYAAVALPLRPPRLALLCLVPAVLAIAADLRILDVPSGSRVVEFREGVMGNVAVVKDAGGHRTLRVDNRFQMGGTAAADAEYRQAHVPLLLHTNPARALFLGVGTGISFGAASLYPGLRAEGVELVPEVVEVIPAFAAANFTPTAQPTLKVFVADARRFVRRPSESSAYDVIIGDVFHPYRDGAGALYTREHFAAVRRRLAPGGLFCQWLPLHQLDEPTLRAIVQTFLAEFPSAEAWLLRFHVDVPVAALIGGREAPLVTTKIVEMRLATARLAGELRRLALGDSLRLYGHLLAAPEDLRAFAGDGPVNTDDNQLVTFLAPRAAYERRAKPYASLLALMRESKSVRAHAVRMSTRAGPEFGERLSRYLGARDVYLQGLVHDAEGRREAAVEAYLESTRLSSEFTSGYAQCVNIATALAASEPARARRILQALIEAQPERRAAAELLQRLGL